MYLSLSLSLSLALCLSSSLSFCWSGHVSSSLWSNVSKFKSLKYCSLKVVSNCICHCLCHCHCHCACLRRCLFAGQVMFSHRPDQMSQRSKVSKIALWRCSLNVFVIVFVFVFVFAFVFLGHAMSSHHSDQMSQLSQVSKIALWRCSLNVFVIVIVFVFVFVFVVVFLVRSCFFHHWSNASKVKSLKDRSLKVFCHCLFVGQVMFCHRSDQK